MTDTPVEAYVITPEQLRARDERIIRATARYIGDDDARALAEIPSVHDAVIAAAEADR